MSKPLYKILAGLASAQLACASPTANDSQRAWGPRHIARIEALVGEFMPSGSGFDSGTQFNFEESTGEVLVFESAFRKRDTAGGDEGMVSFKVVVRPSLFHDFLVDIRGLDAIDDAWQTYFMQEFSYALMREVEIGVFYLDRGL